MAWEDDWKMARLVEPNGQSKSVKQNKKEKWEGTCFTCFYAKGKGNYCTYENPNAEDFSVKRPNLYCIRWLKKR